MRRHQTLRAVATRVFRSLPVTVRKALNNVQVRAADLGGLAGDVLATTSEDGELILVDSDVLERLESNQEILEDVVAHELAHALRARKGLTAADEDMEEREADRLARQWGFNAKGLVDEYIVANRYRWRACRR